MPKQLSIAETEIRKVKEAFIIGKLDEVQLEEYIAFWLKWETLGPVARRSYEMDWAWAKAQANLERDFNANTTA